MKIGINYTSTQNFRANSNEHRRSFMGDISDAIDSTADFMKVAKTAIDSPEEASVKLVTDQIDNVAKSEKTPNWAKTGLKYVSAGLTAGLTGYAAFKAPKGFKNLLSKFKLGRSIIKLASSAKENIGGLLKKVKFDSKLLNSAKTKLINGLTSIKNFLTGKFPKLTEKVSLSNYPSCALNAAATISIYFAHHPTKPNQTECSGPGSICQLVK